MIGSTMRKSNIFSIFLISLIVFSPFFAVSSANISVGVKRGDWIEYQVAEKGNPTPDYNITWARMNITDVNGLKITIDVQTVYANGTIYLEPQIHLDLAKGAIGDGFFIPANFNVGDQFYSEYQGNITISSIRQLEAGGSQRTVVSATSNPTTYYWDKQTGILISATTNFPNFTLLTIASQTNLWRPQILGLDSTLFYIIIILIVVLAALVVISVWHLKVGLHR
jgi:hypothetical protein